MSDLRKRTLLIYGLGGLGMNLCDMTFVQWLFQRYAPENGDILVPVRILGAILLLGRAGEGLYNILIGHWSDHLRSPLGRRIPFVRRALFPLAAAFFLMFMPGTTWPTWTTALYVFVLVQAYLFLYGAVVTPYLALLPELTPDLTQRVNLTTAQSVFMLLSSMIFSFMGTILEQGGWVVVASLVAVATVAAFSPTALFLREKPQAPGKAPAPLIRSIRLTLRNRAFLVIALSTSFYWFSLNMIIVMLPYWVTTALGLTEKHVTAVMVPFLIVNVLAFFVFNVLIRFFGKYTMFLVSLGLSAVVFGLFCLAGQVPGLTLYAQTIVIAGLVGLPVAGFMIIPFALLSDAVDYDEKLTGERREAMFFGVQGVFQKAFLGLSALTFSQLAAFGSTRVSHGGLRMVALAAAVGCLAAFVVFLAYPLRERGGRLHLAGSDEPL